MQNGNVTVTTTPSNYRQISNEINVETQRKQNRSLNLMKTEETGNEQTGEKLEKAISKKVTLKYEESSKKKLDKNYMLYKFY